MSGELLKFEVIIYWSDDDEAFIAEIPELPGCAADGETAQDGVRGAVLDDLILYMPFRRAPEHGVMGAGIDVEAVGLDRPVHLGLRVDEDDLALDRHQIAVVA